MKTKKLTAMALLLAVSLMIFILEAQLPPLAPIPGIKIGLANIVTLVAIVWLGPQEAAQILFLRIILSAVFVGSIMSLIYSTAGGFLSFLAMAAVRRFFMGNKLWIASIIGAIAHNIGQVAAAVVMLATRQIIWYLPILTASAIVAGAFTGVAAMMIVKHIPNPTAEREDIDED